VTRGAVAYRVNGHWIVAPVVRTTAGLGLGIDPVKLGDAPDDGAVAAALERALAASARIVAHPSREEWAGSFEPFLKAAGVRSHKAFMKAAQCVDVDEGDSGLRLIPNRNLGAAGGFEPVQEQAVLRAHGDVSGAASILKALFGADPPE